MAKTDKVENKEQKEEKSLKKSVKSSYSKTKASGSKIFIILESDIAKFTLKSSINLSASKSCFLFNSKISFVFKFFP